MPTCRRNPHHRHLRRHRVSELGRAYHLVTCTDERRPWFSDFASARIVIRCMAYEERLHHVESLAFCLMPNHLHWVFQLEEGATLDQVIQAVKSVSAHRINKRLGRSGAIWESAAHDAAVRDGDDVSEIVDYIIANPLRSNLVTDVRMYPHWDAKWIPEWMGT